MDRSLGRWKKLLGIAAFTTALTAAWLTPREARAQHLMTPTGGRGQLAIDELTGFRVGALTGVSYAGPIGLAFQKYSADNFAGTGGSSSVKATSFWLAPAADYFVLDHLSIGGLLQIQSTSGSVDTTGRNGITTTTDLQSATDFTILPRVGYLIPLGDRWGIWPRGGIGYASRQSLATTVAGRETFSGVYADIDVGFLGRLNETFFFMMAPDITFSLGGSHAADVGAGSVSANASFVQLGLLSSIGVFLDL